MNYNKAKLQQMLAAEYALGTLHGPARRRFERLLVGDAKLRQIVEEWQQSLAPLDYVVTPVQPSPSVWQVIQQRITPRAAPATARTDISRARAAGLWHNLNFWRALGLVATAMAAALLIYLGRAPQPQPTLNYIAVLADTKAQPALLVNYSAAAGELAVSIVAPQSVGSEQSLELWALPQGAAPRSLGLVPASGKAVLKLATDMAQGLPGVPALAVSLEPKGGSPTGAPTGPVLYSGALLKL